MEMDSDRLVRVLLAQRGMLLAYIMSIVRDIHMAEDVFASVGTIISEKGTEEIVPKTDEEWEEVRFAAMGLAETGNLLMFEGRAKDGEDWMKFSESMIDRSVNAAKAAEAKDPERLFRAAGELFDSCNACHNKYIPPDPMQK